MSLPEFNLHFPNSLHDALRTLSALSVSEAAAPLVMAGGTDVLLYMKQRTVQPRSVLSLSKVEETRGIRNLDGACEIGAGTTITGMERGPFLQPRYAGLVDAARSMATPQVRQRATLGGNLATAAACADMPPILIALGAIVEIRSVYESRQVPLQEFFVGVRATALQPGELIAALRLQQPAPHSSSAYVKFGYRRGAQIAVASAAAAVTMDGDRIQSIRLVLGSVAPVPVAVRGASVLVGAKPEGAALAAACTAAAAECAPISDIRGSEAYRRAIVEVIARRAVLQACARAS
jgi:carbon-monoxide dehydrogenase medium subunit